MQFVLNLRKRIGNGIISVIILLWLMIVPAGHGEDNPVFDFGEIIVTATRMPLTLSEVARNVIILDRESIESAPVNSVSDLLEYALGADVTRRGPQGVQADVSIRGSTFEQVLILVDSVRISDPQTGHHSLNIPLNTGDIERIEILKGHGSKMWGAGACGGVINIVTRKDYRNNLTVSLIGGDYRYQEGTATGRVITGPVSHAVSLMRKRSGGYRENTEFVMDSATYRSAFQTKKHSVDFFLGFQDKEFGANSFYSDSYPDQWEHTRTFFSNAAATFNLPACLVTPRMFWRRNEDDFILDRARPDWYRNIHATDSYGLDLQTDWHWSLGDTVLGGRASIDEIKSAGLGDHDRWETGLVLEHRLKPVQRFSIIAGISSHYFSQWGWEIHPGIDLAFRISGNAKLYVTAGKAFRLPTFTELHYDSPANLGNPDLEPESSRSYEIGYDLTVPGFNMNVSLFRREGRNLIDWVRYDHEDQWLAENHTRVDTHGIDITTGFDPRALWKDSPVTRIELSYGYLESDSDSGDLESKYVLNYLEHQMIARVDHRWFMRIRQTWSLRYEDRHQYSDTFLVDTRLSWENEDITVFVSATNLMDIEYDEAGTIPGPGRWVMAGFSLEF